MLLFLKILFQVLAVSIAILVGLLDYVTRDKRTRRFKHIRLLLFVASGVFLVAGILVVVLDHINSEKKYNELAKRASQPIHDVYVDFMVDIPMTHANLEGYHTRLKEHVNEILTSGRLNYNLYIADREATGKVTAFGIPPESALAPKRDSETLAYFILASVGLYLEFYREPQALPVLRPADLLIRVISFFDIHAQLRHDSSHRDANVNLRYYFNKSQFTFVASDFIAHLGHGPATGK